MKVVALFCVLALLISTAQCATSSSGVNVGAGTGPGGSHAHSTTHTSASGPGAHASAHGIAFVLKNGVCVLAKSQAVAHVNLWCGAAAGGWANALSNGLIPWTQVIGAAAAFPCAANALTKAKATAAWC